MVSALGSFHGRTLAALAATGQPTKHEPFQPMPEGFRHVAWGDLDAMRAAVDGSVAAVLIEPIQGEGGVHPATTEYLQGIRELCDEVGALMMIDEIQTGFGRTGRWFGFEEPGVQPRRGDAGQGDGQRHAGRRVLGPRRCRRGVRTRRPRQHVLGHGHRHRGGRGDDRRRCAASTRRRSPSGRAGDSTDGLRALDGVVDVRGRGLMLGAALADGIDAKAVYAELLDRGLIINAVERVDAAPRAADHGDRRRDRRGGRA